MKILFPIIYFGFIILQSVFMYIAYTKSDVNYNLSIYICWWFYYCFCAIQVTAVILSYFVMFSVFILYLVLRFDQINEKFKLISKKKRFRYIPTVKVISEFYSVAYKVIEFNSMMTMGFGVFYLGLGVAIDISLFIAIYGKNSFVKFICGNLAFLLFILAILFQASLSTLITKAHWSYQLINSLIATKRIPLKLKFKVNCLF